MKRKECGCFFSEGMLVIRRVISVILLSMQRSHLITGELNQDSEKSLYEFSFLPA